MKRSNTLFRSIISFFGVFILVTQAYTQSLGYIENKGQWDESIDAQFQLPNGNVWFTDGKVRIALIDEKVMHETIEFTHDNPDEDYFASVHCYEMSFGSNRYDEVNFSGKHKDYINYFIGNNRSKWASRVGVYDELTYSSISEGIHLVWSMENTRLKYTIEVEPKADLSEVFVDYSAVRNLEIKDEKLQITLPNMKVEEQQPFVYQIVDGQRIEIESAFKLNGRRVSFELGDYDGSKKLYIDPVVVASTNVGATVSTFGHSATFDQFGNIVGGGRPFGTGYPTDTGSFQMNFAGGSVDVGISKLNVDGSDLIWSTYLGGENSTEFVHSIVVNGFNQTVVYGKTSSNDYPVSTNAFDTSFNGSIDIFITVLSDSGDAIIGSTYVGGESIDGQNAVPGSYSGFKGEVVCDIYSNVYCASTSSSDSFPTTSSAYQTQIDAMQDGVVFKMSYDLSSMIFSTFLGTELNDAAFNVKPAKDNTVYVCGATASANFPVTTGAHDESFNMGSYDAFITHFDEDGENILHSTYVQADSNSDDKGYFLQIDRKKDIYILGTSAGIHADTSKYEGPNTGSFIRKYSPELDTLYWTSTFTSLAQSAFLVDNCLNIYAAGNAVGAQTNIDTLDAVQTTPGGFYVLLLEPEAEDILMGSYYGNNGSHVDGGTSRFDKRGAVYQATCSSGYFPLNGNAWSGNQNGGTYDLTLFKIDMEVHAAVANAQISPTSAGCVPFSVNFTNFGSQGLSHFWDFGDGDTSNLAEPTHTFTEPGTYEVDYIIFDTGGCVLSDTATLVIVVHDTVPPQIIAGDDECVEFVELTTTSAFATYLWNTGEQSQTIEADEPGQYWLEITNSCGSFADTIDVDFTEAFQFELIEDTGICDPNFFLQGPDSALTYSWSTGDSTQSINIPNTGSYLLVASNGVCADTDSVYISVAYTNITTTDTILCNDSAVFSVNNENGLILWSTGDSTESIVIDSSGTYWVSVENGYCTAIDTIDVIFDPIALELPNDTSICSPIVVNAADSNYTSYNWSTGSSDTSIIVSTTAIIWLEVSNGVCTAVDTMHIGQLTYPNSNDNLQNFCDTLSTTLAVFDDPASSYLWSNGDTNNITVAQKSGDYYVTISQGICQWQDTFSVHFSTTPDIYIPDYSMCQGDSIVIELDSGYSSYFWSNGHQDQKISIQDSGTYRVSVNNDGCEAIETFHVDYLDASRIGSTAIANVLSPNGDGINDAFMIEMNDYTVYTSWRLRVFNRWGTLVYETNTPTIRWSGQTYSGDPLPSGVYYYIVDGETICLQRETVNYHGTINILR